MKNLIYPDWMRPLKILLAGAFVSASILTPVSGQVWANSHNNKIATAIETLKQSDQRWIQIDLSKQNLIAWEGSKPVYAITISSGKRSTPTRVGTFKIQTKLKKTRMQGRGYNVPNVPHTMYYQGGYAIHGAYWHNRFGTPVSHGCVNLAPNHAKWVFEWADVGTPVVIKK
ncbi:L,D-transpeptidase [Anabaena cylindrica FACHB-243]|uniref:ErfK/YbiS/YcfS/YnhG family protein n=1 Tax=Anabaena cylindrica (strain ATCC 27899 / PCC 7122) TaxID=272123 RepID=K9ZB32_ANACC|nr:MULTISPECIES: L,D-transpeptidase [Anabaena]AFZ55792.1 ErfK/YbiS/YcfS/YnhG family protein [Anabaena cylindrica PCC 7122]MBD2420204.1 L,D-transpeptidase [Anabaena cylindrica FACHB-243]MBY5283075.1 L,D-transpeptidase [Anabaena sp. CCAP 1446/1C]MBY5306628.1 L,D-transpeptidase [Anabaena sp. CCAP 1446/1C]MCM2406143.1 L,D-transpeptidase [Anabaena sp. CCAP 1446/1C]